MAYQLPGRLPGGDADHQCPPGPDGHGDPAADRDPLRPFSEEADHGQPEDPGTELPHHRGLQRGHHRREDHQDAGGGGQDGRRLCEGHLRIQGYLDPGGPPARRLLGDDAPGVLPGPGDRPVAGRLYRGGRGWHLLHVHVLCPGPDGAGPLDRGRDLGRDHHPGEHRAADPPDRHEVGRDGYAGSNRKIRRFLQSEKGELGAHPGRHRV